MTVLKIDKQKSTPNRKEDYLRYWVYVTEDPVTVGFITNHKCIEEFGYFSLDCYRILGGSSNLPGYKETTNEVFYDLGSSYKVDSLKEIAQGIVNSEKDYEKQVQLFIQKIEDKQIGTKIQ